MLVPARVWGMLWKIWLKECMNNKCTQMSPNYLFFLNSLIHSHIKYVLRVGGKLGERIRHESKCWLYFWLTKVKWRKKKLARFNGTVDNKQGMMNVEQHLLPLIPINPKPPLFICKLSRILLLFKWKFICRVRETGPPPFKCCIDRNSTLGAIPPPPKVLGKAASDHFYLYSSLKGGDPFGFEPRRLCLSPSRKRGGWNFHLFSVHIGYVGVELL